MRVMKQFIQKLCLLALAAGFLFCACGAGTARLPQGCAIDGQNVSGMSVPCARRLLLRRQREELAGRTFTVRVGGRAYVFRPPELAVRSDLSAVLARAQREGGSHTLQKQLYLRGEERILRGICDELYRPSSPARAEFIKGAAQPVRYVAERRGRFVDGKALRAAVEEALAAWECEACGRVVAVVPAFTLKDARAQMAPLSSFTTCYSEENASRAHNIALAARKLDGAYIRAGGVLSFNAAVGERTARAGFAEAPVIRGGEYVSGVGGGVCQVSTTLYNAALLAGLSAAEVHPHSLAVGYVPPSRDAMVSGADCDLKLKNDLAGGVRIAVHAGAGQLTVSVYGRRSPYRYAIESAVTAVLPPPAPEVRQGRQERELRPAKEGLISEAYLVRRGPGGEETRTLLRSDRYAPVRAVLERAAGAENITGRALKII